MPAQLANLIPRQEPKVIATGFGFTEGPVWHPDGYLLFSDIPASIIYKWTPGGTPQPSVTHSRNSNGLTYDRQRRLVACEHGGRQVSRMDENGLMTTVVNNYEGMRLNSPNDLVVHSSGAIYFTDPPYGIDPDPGELGIRGVYRVNPDGGITLLVSDFVRPNGLAFSPDESILYVDDSRRRHIRAFDVGADGSLTHDRVFVDMNAPVVGNPDGMKVDTQGNVYCAGAGGLWVMDSEGGHLGTIKLPELPANLAFGGPDHRTIYLTARTSLYRIQANIPGLRVL